MTTPFRLFPALVKWNSPCSTCDTLAVMKLLATRKSEQNRAAVDPWTAVHLAAGLALGLMAVPLRHALATAVIYEAAEQVFERRACGQSFFETSGPEVLPNALVDMVAFAAGHWLGRAWNAS
ncbi:MAG TPA: hypothetical protein VK002_06245 [Rubricoccaceae bacterium]|nr:hypothetical protein [Rubricoccaceae bacterium]